MRVRQYRRSHNRITALALGLALGMSAFIGPCWWSIVRFHQPACSEARADFVAFYTAAKLMLSERAGLYDLEVQRSVQQEFNPERPFTAYYYPPIFALLLGPLGWLSFSQAFIAMTLVNLGLLWVSLRILIRRLALSRQQSRWLILATLCNYGVYYALLEGQSSFIVLLLLVLYVTAGGTGAGVWSGLLFFKPSLALVPFALLFGRRKWPAVAVAICVGVVLGFVSFVAVGMDGIERYVAISKRLISEENYLRVPHDRMHNLRALAYFLVGSGWQEYVWAASTLAVLGLSAILIWAKEMSAGIWALVLIAFLLTAPHLHEHDLALLIVPSAFFLKSAGESLSPGSALALVGLGMVSLINTVVYLPPFVPIILLSYFLIGGVEEWQSLGDCKDPEYRFR